MEFAAQAPHPITTDLLKGKQAGCPFLGQSQSRTPETPLTAVESVEVSPSGGTASVSERSQNIVTAFGETHAQLTK